MLSDADIAAGANSQELALIDGFYVREFMEGQLSASPLRELAERLLKLRGLIGMCSIEE